MPVKGEPDQAMQDAEKKDQPSEGDLNGRVGAALKKGDGDLLSQADSADADWQQHGQIQQAGVNAHLPPRFRATHGG